MTGSTKPDPQSTTELVRYTSLSPFGAIRQLLDQLDLATPRVDISHDGEQLHIEIDLPGMRPTDIQVTIDDYSLELEGERNGHRFHRVVRLPHYVDPNTAEATFDAGTLVIDVRAPAESQRGRRLEIKTGGANVRE
jgi:HSP20 family protein